MPPEMTEEHVSRLLDEGERIRCAPGIVFVDDFCGWRARSAGTGLDVFEVIATYLAEDMDMEQLMRSYHWLTGDQLLAALDYARAYPEEINALIQEGEALVPEEIRATYPPLRWAPE